MLPASTRLMESLFEPVRFFTLSHPLFEAWKHQALTKGNPHEKTYPPYYCHGCFSFVANDDPSNRFSN